jgi:hypothetical protein
VVAGRVYDETRGECINDAIVFSDFGIQTRSINCDYMMVHPSGIFNFTVVAKDHANYEIKNVTVNGGDVRWMEMAMEPGISDTEAVNQSNSTGSTSYCFIATAASDIFNTDYLGMKINLFCIGILIFFITLTRLFKLRLHK